MTRNARPRSHAITVAHLRGTITIDVHLDHPIHSFDPRFALGAGVDGMETGEIDRVYTPSNIRAMRSAGLRSLTYRLRTELAIDAWHWSPVGHWSDPVHQQGYWTSDPETRTRIETCSAYALPRRGDSIDQAENHGWSRLDDGDPATFWKSNPYLDQHYTREENTRHPQWVVVDLNDVRPIDTMRIVWGKPYALSYQVQYCDLRSSRWRVFPGGDVRRGAGGDVRLRLSARPIASRYVRIRLVESSGTAPARSTDLRDRLGFAIREIELGQVLPGGAFLDWIRHAPDRTRQTTTWVSSTDPWHRAVDRDPSVEQVGFDRLFASGLTSGLPVMMAAPVLYDVPENAAAEVRFLQNRNYPVGLLELGEEPDGQMVEPADYGALYLQAYHAIREVAPRLPIGGPSFQNVDVDDTAWPQEKESSPWLARLTAYLQSRGEGAALSFVSFEWYPFDRPDRDPTAQLVDAPRQMAAAFDRIGRCGLPRSTPLVMSEYGYSAFATEFEVDLAGAIFDVEAAAQFLSLGGARAYFYGYEPGTLMKDRDTFGNLLLFIEGPGHELRPVAACHAARLLTQAWTNPNGGEHQIYPCSVDEGATGNLVTAYAVRQPNGLFAILLVNKSPHGSRVRVRFGSIGNRAVEAASGSGDLLLFSSRQYRWRPNGEQGRADPDLPPEHHRVQFPGAAVSLPPRSMAVLRLRLRATS